MYNFIEEYPGMFTQDFCDAIIRRLEDQISTGQSIRQDKISKNQDNRIAMDWAYHHTYHYLQDPELVKVFYNTVQHTYNERYSTKYSFLLDQGQHTPKGMTVQRTAPHEGYHAWHCEAGNLETSPRMIAYTAYMNDVEEGGETEYLYQGIKVKPEMGKLVFWPAGWTHPHRGNPIYKGYKYIITGWYTFDNVYLTSG